MNNKILYNKQNVRIKMARIRKTASGIKEDKQNRIRF